LKHELRGKNAPITAGFIENTKLFLENLKVWVLYYRGNRPTFLHS
jgi:hypothetical protein